MILLAYPMAYWIAFYGGRWKSTLFFMILVPFFVSFVIRTVQWKFILGRRRAAARAVEDHRAGARRLPGAGDPVAVIAGITYNFLPFTALPLYVALERIDTRLVEAAKDLYASRFEAFRKVVLPLSFPGLFAAVILTFVPATGDYVNSACSACRTTMIGQVIQPKFLTENDYPEAAALSVILMLGMLVVAIVYARVLGTEDATLAAAAAHERGRVDGGASPTARRCAQAPALDLLHPARVHDRDDRVPGEPGVRDDRVQFQRLARRERQIAKFTCCTLEWWQESSTSRP